jgi:hypothetical protein
VTLEYRDQVRAALTDIRVESNGVSWRGRHRPLVPPRVRRVLEPDAARKLLHRELQLTLYSEFYCLGGARAPALSAAVPEAARRPFIEALSAANQGTGCWDEGWTHATELDADVLRRQGLELRVRPSEWRISPESADEAELRLPKELASVWPGFYLAQGDATIREREWEHTARLYWNVTAPAAIALTRMITETFNDQGVPFRFKVLVDLQRFRRCDSAVLYLRARDLAPALPHLASMYDRLNGGLLPGVPALTFELAPGLALAESPPLGESFGLHRCGLLASAVLRASDGHARQLPTRLAVATEQFRASGVDLDRPYTVVGSQLCDGVALPATHSRGRSAFRRHDVPVDRQSFVNAALAIGMTLVDRALWSGDRCTWIGPRRPHDPLRRVARTESCTSIGGDLQSGSGGIAMLLSELAVLTGDRALHRTAIGAAKHALSWAATPSQVLGGLYSGAMSAILAAACAGMRLDTTEIVNKALDLMLRRATTHRDDTDLLSGRAGEVVVLLALSELLAEPALVAHAVAAADGVLRASHRSGDGVSWLPGAGSAPNLLGMAHGTAGIATALVEVFAITRDDRYRIAALDAFLYERAWFDPQRGNWPVLPSARAASTLQRSRRLGANAYWCHGSAGAALARLRAHEILDTPELMSEASVALDTTRADVEALGDVRLADFCLCHGLAGSASALLEGSTRLRPAAGAWGDMARRVARAGLEFEASTPGWLYDAAQGGPGLLVGSAGVAMLYLQLVDPAMPSPLLVRPRELACRLRH